MTDLFTRTQDRAKVEVIFRSGELGIKRWTFHCRAGPLPTPTGLRSLPPFIPGVRAPRR